MAEAAHSETMDLEEMLASLSRLQGELEEHRSARAKAELERDEYRMLYELVYLELERTRRHLFGKKGERVADEQLALAFMKVAEAMKAFEGARRRPAPERPARRHERQEETQQAHRPQAGARPSTH